MSNFADQNFDFEEDTHSAEPVYLPDEVVKGGKSTDDTLSDIFVEAEREFGAESFVDLQERETEKEKADIDAIVEEVTFEIKKDMLLRESREELVSPKILGVGPDHHSPSNVDDLSLLRVLSGRRRTEDNRRVQNNHNNEDDTMQLWRDHKKHFFILSNAGKPIWSRYGDENKLAGFSGVLQGIISFVQDYNGDTIRMVTAGRHQMLFLLKGPIYLVSVCSTLEPRELLKDQLELIYGQILMILTKAIDHSFVKNPKFDLRVLLGGTDNIFRSLSSSFSWNHSATLKAYACLRLPVFVRKEVNAALFDASNSPNVFFALLFCEQKVVAIAHRKKLKLEVFDIFLLLNFINSSESLRSSEAFSPICLPKYNNSAFLYAYIDHIQRDMCLVFLTPNSDAFFDLKKRREIFEEKLLESGALGGIFNAMKNGGPRLDEVFQNLRVFEPISNLSDEVADDVDSISPFENELDDENYDIDDDPEFVEKYETTSNPPEDTGSGKSRALGETGSSVGLIHFLYRLNKWEQFVSSDYVFPLTTKKLQKRLFRRYQTIRASLIGNSDGYKGQTMQYKQDDEFVIFSWRTKDFEIYVTFDGMAEKESALIVCNRVNHWIKKKQNELFLLKPVQLLG